MDFNFPAVLKTILKEELSPYFMVIVFGLLINPFTQTFSGSNGREKISFSRSATSATYLFVFRSFATDILSSHGTFNSMMYIELSSLSMRTISGISLMIKTSGGSVPPPDAVRLSMSKYIWYLSESNLFIISLSAGLCLKENLPWLSETLIHESTWLKVSFQPQFLHLSLFFAS